MSLTSYTAAPADFLKDFNTSIAQTEPKGRITTWERHSDKVHYTHKASNWYQKAYFKPSVKDGVLVFNIVAPKGKEISLLVYAYYHVHLTETFLVHFNGKFTDAASSSMPRAPDVVRG